MNIFRGIIIFFFMLIFLILFIWVYSPNNKKRFNDYSKIPMNDLDVKKKYFSGDKCE